MGLVLTALTPSEFLEIVDGAPQHHRSIFEEEPVAPMTTSIYRTRASRGRSLIVDSDRAFLTPPGLNFRSGEQLVSMDLRFGGDWLLHLSTLGCPSLLIVSKEALMAFIGGEKWLFNTTSNDRSQPFPAISIRALLHAFHAGLDAGSAWHPVHVCLDREHIPVNSRGFDLMDIKNQLRVLGELHQAVLVAKQKSASSLRTSVEDALCIARECRGVVQEIMPSLLAADADLSSPFGDGWGMAAITELLATLRLVENT